MISPRVVFGMPAYNRPDSLGQTLESLLSQTYGSFAIVMVDDCPTPEARAIVEKYSALDARLVYEPNPTRLGMIGNWRRAFERGRQMFPRSEYFAWVSDHDVWHPRWLEVLVQRLDKHPEVVLAYPQMIRVYAYGRRRITSRFDTRGVRNPRHRLHRTINEMTAGNCIYGLFRTDALARAGVFRPVLLPDRQVLVELSLFGQFSSVPEILWHREVAGVFSYTRQRRMLFASRSPLPTYLPANVQHFGVVLWDLAALGRGRPALGRLAGACYAVLQLCYSTTRELTREDTPWRAALERSRLGRWLFTLRAARTRALGVGGAGGDNRAAVTLEQK